MGSLHAYHFGGRGYNLQLTEMHLLNWFVIQRAKCFICITLVYCPKLKYIELKSSVLSKFEEVFGTS